jgi:hypothetical protein
MTWPNLAQKFELISTSEPAEPANPELRLQDRESILQEILVLGRESAIATAELSGIAPQLNTVLVNLKGLTRVLERNAANERLLRMTERWKPQLSQSELNALRGFTEQLKNRPALAIKPSGIAVLRESERGPELEPSAEQTPE